MIVAEFKITNKKNSIKRMKHEVWMNHIKVGQLIDVEFPKENLTWECEVKKVQLILNDKDTIYMFELSGITTVWPDGTRGYKSDDDIRNMKTLPSNS